MVQFSDEWLERVKKASDIVDVVSSKVDLKVAGKSYVGRCPFHDEKTPSFSINRDKQLFYCFGCGAGGTVFNFVMLSESLTFPEAAAALAQRAGIALPAATGKDEKASKERETIYRINHAAAEFFYRQLRTEGAEQAREYLSSRGIGTSLARQFFLGFAPNSWTGLLDYLKERGFSPQQAVDAGLAGAGQNGFYDTFRDRIVFPIVNHQGKFLGFGGRLLGPGHPKYLNTRETLVFQKHRALYGLNWSKDQIKKAQCAVLVEGYTDCISLWGRGIQNTAASLGTAFTVHHAKLLQRFTGKVILAFDGDPAGEQAVYRSLDVLRQAGLQVSVAPLEPGVDPDTFARQHSSEAVVHWLQQAQPFREYLIRRAADQADMSTREGKLEAAETIVGILLQADSLVEREEYLRLA